jgi:hypothetical protein
MNFRLPIRCLLVRAALIWLTELQPSLNVDLVLSREDEDEAQMA